VESHVLSKLCHVLLDLREYSTLSFSQVLLFILRIGLISTLRSGRDMKLNVFVLLEFYSEMKGFGFKIMGL
jgi:hypothetical protein